MARGNWQVEHLLRRAAFGTTAADLIRFGDASAPAVVDYLVDYDRLPDDVDSKIGQSAYVSVTAPGRQFSPNTNIDDARQRWLFRMVHSERQLQEKMALFWHNHFATGYSKVAGVVGGIVGTKMMAGKGGELPGPEGQIELFRRYALGNFTTLLTEVAKHPSMIIWLDGRQNVRTRPQENFAREIMELFTWGVGHYTEQDVYAAARVFTGWNLSPLRGATTTNDPAAYYEFLYNPNNHETTAKTFTFPIYSNGSTTIPARTAADGMQDGIDFIGALARHPETARRLARKLWGFFVSDLETPPADFVEAVAAEYVKSNTEMKPVVRFILNSPWFNDPDRWFSRYSWPAEFVARSIREVGWNGLSVQTSLTPLTNMGQTLFEPPNVAGWELGAAWITTGSMLSRMNFASMLAGNQKFNLVQPAIAFAASPESLLDYFLDKFSPAPYDLGPYQALAAYLRAGITWNGTAAQLNTKVAGLTRLIIGSSEYQFV